MSEFTLALILAVAKQIPRATTQQREHAWKPFGPHRLSGRTLGVLGLGAIGHAVARRAAALGMRVIGTKRHPEPLAGVDEVLPASETRRVLEESDVVVVVLPRTPETAGLLDADAIAAMKPGAQLVNIARGGIVDEAALAKALREGALSGAAFDVFEEEPLPPSSPLWDTPNLLITPHVAGFSREYMARLAGIFFENIRRLERGEPLREPRRSRQGLLSLRDAPPKAPCRRRALSPTPAAARRPHSRAGNGRPPPRRAALARLSRCLRADGCPPGPPGGLASRGRSTPSRPRAGGPGGCASRQPGRGAACAPARFRAAAAPPPPHHRRRSPRADRARSSEPRRPAAPRRPRSPRYPSRASGNRSAAPEAGPWRPADSPPDRG